MKKGTFLLVGGAAVCVAIIGVVVLIKYKKSNYYVRDNYEREEDKQKKLNADYSKSMFDNADDLMEETINLRNEVCEDIKRRHEVAADYIKEAVKTIHEEETSDDYEVDSVHQKLKDLINDL